MTADGPVSATNVEYVTKSPAIFNEIAPFGAARFQRAVSTRGFFVGASFQRAHAFQQDEILLPQETRWRSCRHRGGRDGIEREEPAPVSCGGFAGRARSCLLLTSANCSALRTRPCERACRRAAGEQQTACVRDAARADRHAADARGFRSVSGRHHGSTACSDAQSQSAE